jgi:hypothetical protein
LKVAAAEAVAAIANKFDSSVGVGASARIARRFGGRAREDIELNDRFNHESRPARG